MITKTLQGSKYMLVVSWRETCLKHYHEILATWLRNRLQQVPFFRILRLMLHWAI